MRRRHRNGRRRAIVNHDDQPREWGMLAWARMIRPNNTLHSATWDMGHGTPSRRGPEGYDPDIRCTRMPVCTPTHCNCTICISCYPTLTLYQYNCTVHAR